MPGKKESKYQVSALFPVETIGLRNSGAQSLAIQAEYLESNLFVSINKMDPG